jgi:phosphoserine phosphatase
MEEAAIPREDPRTVVDRLERARDEALRRSPSADVVLAFDADGTLWSGDVGIDLFEAFLAEGRVEAAALAALEREAEHAGVEARGDALAIARGLYAAFEAERYHEARAFAMMAWAFAGWAIDEVLAFAEAVLDRARIDERYHPEIAPVLAWARDRGVATYVVSASPRPIVERGAARLGFPREHVLAMTPAVSGGRVEPRLEGPSVYAEGKVEALLGARPGAEILGGFGDSTYDAAFLRRARVPVAVRPKAGLVRLAASIPALVSLEPG